MNAPQSSLTPSPGLPRPRVGGEASLPPPGAAHRLAAPTEAAWETPSEGSAPPTPRSAPGFAVAGPSPSPTRAPRRELAPALPLESPALAPTPATVRRAAAPVDEEQTTASNTTAGRSKARSTRARWDDYLSPPEALQPEELPTLQGVLSLDNPAPAPQPSPLEPGQTLARASNATSSLPFEVPARVQPPALQALDPDPHRWLRRTALTLITVLAAMLLLFKGPTHWGMPGLLPGQPLPDGTYGRWSGAVTPELQVLWAVRTDDTLTVRLPAEWQKRPRLARITDLRHLKATFPDVMEILVLNPDSELLAETYGDTYHLYQ